MDLDSTKKIFRILIINFIYSDTNIRKDRSIARTFGDDPFALDGFGDCKFRILIDLKNFRREKEVGLE
jgi:hypothetical protein